MKNKMFLGIIIVLLIVAGRIGAKIIIDNQKENDIQKYINKSKQTTNSEKNNNTNTNITTQKSNIGKYTDKSEYNGYYREAILEITNQTNSSIDFNLSASAGTDVNHVSTGDVIGKANKIEIPQDYIIPESTQYAYQFVDNIEGKTYKITFIYTAHKKFEYVNIIEDYPDNFNPYAGHGVYFKGEYEKIYK